MIRICPKRDAVCPHGMACPYVIDRYDCKEERPLMNPDIAERGTDVGDFTFDTSGRVECPSSFQPLGWAIWPDLTPFEQGFTKAAFARLDLLNLNCDDEGGRGLHPRAPAFRDLAPEALAMIRRDCAAYEAAQKNMRVWSPEREGRLFWDDRQNERPLAKGFPPLTVSLTDDGKVYLR